MFKSIKSIPIEINNCFKSYFDLIYHLYLFICVVIWLYAWSLYLARNHEFLPRKNTEMDVFTSKNGINPRFKYPIMFKIIILIGWNTSFVKKLCVDGVMAWYVHYVWPKIMKFAQSKIQKWMYLHQKMESTKGSNIQKC